MTLRTILLSKVLCDKCSEQNGKDVELVRRWERLKSSWLMAFFVCPICNNSIRIETRIDM